MKCEVAWAISDVNFKKKKAPYNYWNTKWLGMEKGLL